MSAVNLQFRERQKAGALRLSHASSTGQLLPFAREQVVNRNLEASLQTGRSRLAGTEPDYKAELQRVLLMFK